MPEVGKFYWVWLAKWEPAERVEDADDREVWRLIGVDADYYDNEISKVGPELKPPVD